MHILFVENGYPLKSGGGGGAGTYVQLIGKALVKKGHAVSVIASPSENAEVYEIDEGIEVYRPKFSKTTLSRLIGKLPFFWRYSKLVNKLTNKGLYKKLLAIHQQNPIDVIEFTEGGDLWNAIKQTFSYVSHLHGSGYTFKRNSGQKVTHVDWLFRKIELIGVKNAKVVIAPAQAMIDLVEREAKTTFAFKQVIPLPLDNRLIDQMDQNVEKEKYKNIVLFAARNDPVKGADTLLSAIPEVEKRIPDVEFRFFGFEPKQGQKIPNSVKATPFIPKDQLIREYQKADVCVVPSFFDNSPNTVYEAMAAGKPIVATNVGGIPELVKDGETGKVIEPQRPRQLAHAIIELLERKEESKLMGKKGNKRIQQLGSIQENLEKRVELYHWVMHNFHKTRS